MNNTILQVRNLTYSYEQGHSTLTEINLDIKKGEKIAVLGANGAGKSTFFLNLNGVLRPEVGEIIYCGNTITRKNLSELRKNVGIVFQDADNQIIAPTVRAEISFGPMNLKLPKDKVRERVEEAIAYMDLSEFRNRAPHYLSGGEKKRVSIADIIAMKSEIMIFDEPTASLDPVNAKMLEDVLQQLEDDGKTLIISTHDVDFAYRWAKRVLVFSKGKIIADDSPLSVFQNEDVIQRANLKRPMLLDIYEMLMENKWIPHANQYPTNVTEFNLMLKEIDERYKYKNNVK